MTDATKATNDERMVQIPAALAESLCRYHLDESDHHLTLSRGHTDVVRRLSAALEEKNDA